MRRKQLPVLVSSRRTVDLLLVAGEPLSVDAPQRPNLSCGILVDALQQNRVTGLLYDTVFFGRLILHTAYCPAPQNTCSQDIDVVSDVYQ